MGKFLDKIKENAKQAAEVRQKRAANLQAMKETYKAEYNKELKRANAAELKRRAKANARRSASNIALTRTERVQKTARNISQGAEDISNTFGDFGFSSPQKSKPKSRKKGSKKKRTSPGLNDFDMDFGDFDF